MQRNRQIIASFAALVVILVIIGAISVTSKKTATTDTAAVTTTTATTASGSSYKDGTFTATGGYNAPSGAESVDVSVTLKNGIISTATVTANSDDNTSEYYSEKFIAAYKQYVVGKNISELSLSRTAGASLTTKGFNNAIEQIQSEAAA